MIEEVVDAVKSKVEALSLDLDGVALPVEKARQPKHEEGVTPTSQVTIHATPRPHDWKRFTVQHDLHTYRVRVVLWTPGNIEPRAVQGTASAPTSAHSTWQDAIISTLDSKPADLLGLDNLRDVRAKSGSYLDRGSFAKGWDSQAVDVEVDIVRTR